MSDAEKVTHAQDLITRELHKLDDDRIDKIEWEQTPQGRLARLHRLVIFRRGEKSIFIFTEYELLKDFGSDKWEHRLQCRVGDIQIDFEVSERIGEKIGEALVRIGAMKPYQMDDVLRAQKSGDNRLFGEIAIECGYINDEVLKKYVEAKAVGRKRI
jgi:hypothetical protein